MTESYFQILRAADGTGTSGAAGELRCYTAADLAARTETLRARIAELEAELAWYRHSQLGAINDQEIQTIISNL